MNEMIDVIADADGAVSVPREILAALRVVPGDQVRFILLSDGSIVVHVRNRSMRELAGMFYREDQAVVPIEQMSPWE